MRHKLGHSLLCLTITLLMIALAGCNRKPDQPERAIQVETLLLDESSIPAGWKLLSIDNDPMISWGEASGIEKIFYYEGFDHQFTRGGVTIYHHFNEALAMKWYKKQEKGKFNPDSPWSTTPLFVPENLQTFAPAADEWRFKCKGISDGLLEDSTICELLARYRDIVLYFNITIEYGGQETITIAELEVLLNEIDDKIMEGLREYE